MDRRDRLVGEVRQLVKQLVPLNHGLRDGGVGRAFLSQKKMSKGAIQCWIQIERMLEISEELTYLLGYQTEPGGETARMLAAYSVGPTTVAPLLRQGNGHAQGPAGNNRQS